MMWNKGVCRRLATIGFCIAISPITTQANTVPIQTLDDRLNELAQMHDARATGIQSRTRIQPDIIKDGFYLDQKTLTQAQVENLVRQPGQGNVFRIAMNNPVTMKFIPGEDALFVVEKRGVVRKVTYDVMSDGSYDNFQLLPDYVLDIRDIVSTAVDRGLLGLAIDPNYASNGYIYLGYTLSDGSPDGFVLDTSIAGCENQTPETATDNCTQLLPKTANVSRYQVFGDIADPGSRFDLLTDIPAESGSHAAALLDFFLDGSLAVITGDGAGYFEAEVEAFRSMDLTSLSGKVLRIDPQTGLGYADNPFYTGDPGAIQSKVWALGLRNAFGLQIVDTGNNEIGELIGTHVGWNQVEKVLHVTRGSFHGWSCFGPEADVTHYRTLCRNENPPRPTDLNGNEIPIKPPALIGRHQVRYNYASAFAGGSFLESVKYGDFRNQYVFFDYRLSQTYRGVHSNRYSTLSVPREAPGGDNAPLIPFIEGGLTAPVASIIAPNGMVYIVDIFVGRVDGISFGAIVKLGYEDGANPVDPIEPLVSEANITVDLIDGNSLARTFDCSDSVVHTGGQANCRWDFGDGTTRTVAMGTAVDHQYTTQGTYSVTMTLQSLTGGVLATVSDDVTVVDLNTVQLPQPFFESVTFPGNDIAVSDDFDVIVRIGNAGSGQPFIAMLHAYDANATLVPGVETSVRVSGLGNGEFDTLTFADVLIREEGVYDFYLEYGYTDEAGNDLGSAPNVDYVGQMTIFPRAGGEPTEPEPTEPEPTEPDPIEPTEPTVPVGGEELVCRNAFLGGEVGRVWGVFKRSDGAEFSDNPLFNAGCWRNEGPTPADLYITDLCSLQDNGRYLCRDGMSYTPEDLEPRDPEGPTNPVEPTEPEGPANPVVPTEPVVVTEIDTSLLYREPDRGLPCSDAPPLRNNKGWDGKGHCHVYGEPFIYLISDQPGYETGDTIGMENVPLVPTSRMKNSYRGMPVESISLISSTTSGGMLNPLALTLLGLIVLRRKIVA